MVPGARHLMTSGNLEGPLTFLFATWVYGFGICGLGFRVSGVASLRTSEPFLVPQSGAYDRCTLSVMVRGSHWTLSRS